MNLFDEKSSNFIKLLFNFNNKEFYIFIGLKKFINSAIQLYKFTTRYSGEPKKKFINHIVMILTYDNLFYHDF